MSIQKSSPRAEASWSSNALRLRGGPFGEAQVPFGVSCLHKIIERSGYRDVVVDASRCTFCHPGFMVPIITQMERYRREKGVTYTLEMPTHSDSLERLFVNANWAHIMQPDRWPERSRDDYGNHIPLRRYSTEEQMHVLVNEAIESILHTRKVDRDSLHGVEWSLNEIADNVLQHSGSSIGGFLQLNLPQQRGFVEFMVADAGRGISHTLRVEDHQTALRESILFGRTRDTSNHMGDGLYGSYRTALCSHGSFNLNSGKASLFLSHGEELLQESERRVPYIGTFVSCALSFNEPEAFRRALSWEGGDVAREGEERVGYLDIKYGGGETLELDMKEYRSFLGSRTGGKKFRRRLDNLLKEGKSVGLNFSGVSMVSSGFADEALAMLIRDIGDAEFRERVGMRGASDIVGFVIDRAIRHRLAVTAAEAEAEDRDDDWTDEGWENEGLESESATVSSS
ncbi:MAG: STAS-like domain-containing protein, partial [Alphaproteobacteria bacterium]|nr:STAS-like domain-containing protein [Alphaproteobacteria bacterium]